MARAKIMKDREGRYIGVMIDCPGCGRKRLRTDWTPEGMVQAPSDGRHVWGFNGDLDRPTFTPSLLWKSGHHCYNPPVPGKCWCDYDQRYPDNGHPDHPVCIVCHSFVRDGRIQFLSDCTHELAGQTVDLPEIE